MAQVSVVLDGRGGPDVGPLLVEVQPRAATVAKNTYHEADTWSLEFDLRALPMDPDLIRSAVVAIYMWAAETYDESIEWARDEYRMSVGLADEGELVIDASSQAVRFEGRDYSGLLLDREWDPAATIIPGGPRGRVPVGYPIDEVVQAIADSAAPPGASLRFKVAYESKENPIPPLVGAGRRDTKRKKGLPAEAGKSLWDVIYDLCLSHGLIVYVRGEAIVITDPNTFESVGAVTDAPVVAYGRELLSLQVKRRLAKERVPQIRVVGYDSTTRQRVEVIYPEKHVPPDTGLGLKKDERILLPAPKGEYDRAALERYAAARCANMGRAEASYSFTTRHLHPELLGLEAGRPVFISFDPFNAENFRSLSVGQRVEHLVAAGYDTTFAGVLAESFERLQQFRQPYYTRQAEFTYALDDGLTISCEAVNYAYEPREQAEQALQGAPL